MRCVRCEVCEVWGDGTCNNKYTAPDITHYSCVPLRNTSIHCTHHSPQEARGVTVLV